MAVNRDKEFEANESEIELIGRCEQRVGCFCGAGRVDADSLKRRSEGCVRCAG